MTEGISLRVVARIILLRHAHSVANENGILAGRISGIALSKQGRDQAKKLTERIGSSDISSIRVSPMQRCDETIAPWLSTLASSQLKDLQIADGLNEVDYGAWSGRKLSTLSKDPLWKVIQSTPSKVRFPDGERMLSMQKRALSVISGTVKDDSKGNHLFVSHGDVIKAIIAGLLDIKFDSFQKLIIDPASISIFEISSSGAKMISYNDTTQNIEALLNQKMKRKNTIGGGAGLVRKLKK